MHSVVRPLVPSSPYALDPAPARPVTASEDGPPSGGLGGSADLASERGGRGWLVEAGGGGGGGGGGMHLAGPDLLWLSIFRIYIGRRRRLLRKEGTLATMVQGAYY